MDDRARLTGSHTAASRTRSFGGCVTCRSRHLKCDEIRPTCTTCSTSKVVCNGYNRRIFFDTKDGGKARYRQVLFTNEERAQMISQMIESVPLRKADAVLMEIENECEQASQNSEAEVDLSCGPFGVFRPSSSTSDQLLVHAPRTISPLIDLSDPENFQLPDWLEMSLLFSDYEAASSPPTMCMPSPKLTQGYVLSYGHGESRVHTSMPDTFSSPSILQDASFLLKHYVNNYIPSLTPFRHTKTPWHVLFLPNAKSTLASIAIGEEVDAANSAIFFGTLLISAIDLNHHSLDHSWSAQATILTKYAQENMSIMLEHALDRPKRFKYKSIIMAILTMVQISMVDGSWDQTGRYLLEAEKIVRLRGLTKFSKSRKVRMLHHCYTYIRLFHESLSLSPTWSTLQGTIMDDIQRSGPVLKGVDSSSFRLIPWDDLEEKFKEIKTREQGENDLHLGSPGIWAGTLYPEIFGVPETWFNLLSQVIRLGNEKEVAADANEPALPLKEFAQRAKALETYILRWRFPDDLVTTSGGLQVMEVDWIMLETMQNALHHALAIYFYRRIHDVDPIMLQAKVQKVKDCLYACKQICESGGGFFDGWMWPAFIAGCEALDIGLQRSFTEWFDFSRSRGKQSSSIRMQQLVDQVWDERRRDSRRSKSWL